ncbi:Ldh family oxidoreductase (plasmid) [Peribacillus sp. RS7]|uniref:Ldh family oxidoreductase n=1 Tax=Peribacillus sp. RS7 TaxID=3242679 RepID=UPI0035BFDA5C
MNNQNTTRVQVSQVKRVITTLFNSYGISERDSEVITNSFIEADLCGVNTHGVTVVPAHIEKLKVGGYNINPNIRKVREGISFAVVDGDGSFGALSAEYSMKLAKEEAKQKGTFSVFSYNNNTFGPAFYYSAMAAEEGLIGIVMCNTPPAMAPWNGNEKLLGTNPFSISIPVKKGFPITLDMATSQVAKSKINIALRDGKEIPIGWATDINGDPTTDPQKAVEGMVLPLGGYKGYGISMMVDILSGVLSGASFLNDVGSFYRNMENCMNVGFMFVVIDPKLIIGEVFYDLIKDYYNIIKSSSSVIKGDEILIPGDRKSNFKKQFSDTGIEINKETINKLNQYLLENNINMKLA